MSLLTANLWPSLVLAVASVTTIALVRADKRDIPAIFASFAQAFGIHKPMGQPEERRDTGQMTPPTEIEQTGDEA
ncbi:hypothetical protein [Nocardia sp. NPDC019255]|uniref:hypothetical protein n=1 Tax=Nocardia sp. NPDC019255 TaxID=3154591 RepID=UPI0033D6795A